MKRMTKEERAKCRLHVRLLSKAGSTMSQKKGKGSYKRNAKHKEQL